MVGIPDLVGVPSGPMAMSSPENQPERFTRRYQGRYASDIEPLIENGALLERNFPSAEHLWEFVPPWVHELLMMVFTQVVDEGFWPDPMPDLTGEVTTVWEGSTVHGTGWVFRCRDFSLPFDLRFDYVQVERFPAEIPKVA